MTSAWPLLITPAELEERLQDPTLLLIDLCHPDQYPNAHIPGAHYVSPAETQRGGPPAPGLLPDAQRLQALANRLGLSADKQVVVYDDEGGGWAGRMMWLLHAIGHDKVTLLDGGLRAWYAEGRPLTREAPPTGTSQAEIQLNPAVSISREEVLENLGQPDFCIWDARSKEEYLGLRQTAFKNGHIPGAVHFEWTAAMDPRRDLRLKPLEALRKHLESLGITADKRVITHCQTHHRSGLTYAIGKILGLDIRAYPGSWSEWGNHPDSPVEKT